MHTENLSNKLITNNSGSQQEERRYPFCQNKKLNSFYYFKNKQDDMQNFLSKQSGFNI